MDLFLILFMIYIIKNILFSLTDVATDAAKCAYVSSPGDVYATWCTSLCMCLCMISGLNIHFTYIS